MDSGRGQVEQFLRDVRAVVTKGNEFESEANKNQMIQTFLLGWICIELQELNRAVSTGIKLEASNTLTTSGD